MKKTISLFLAMCMLFSFVCVVNAEEISKNFELSVAVDTTTRGYQMIGGNVCDLDGTILIELENGFTADGYTLDPDFRVYYEQDSIGKEIENLEVSESAQALAAATEIFNGTANLPKNVDGNQGVQVGSTFIVSASQPDVRIYYSSGTPSGVNMAVHNVTRGTVVGWVSNVQPKNYSSKISVYNSSRPNDTYKAMCSAQGSAGTATIKIEKL